MLQGKHITFSYSDSAKGKIDVLKDVSFEIREHDFIGLIGTSGSGKTTLIKHLNGLLKAESGEIFFNGKIYIVKISDFKIKKRSWSCISVSGAAIIWQDDSERCYVWAAESWNE